jgi:hypothetical protein
MMLWAGFIALSALVHDVTAQSGIDLDGPMLRGGGPRGTSAMLRFGCSQVRNYDLSVNTRLGTELLGCHRTS